eukprot:scaffold2314_cov203-Skeletonema_marinoi.AAC.3
MEKRRSIHDLVGTSTAAQDTTFYIDKGKHPSSQTEKMCLETAFESYKALFVVGYSRSLSGSSTFCPIQHDLACRWKRGLVGTSTAANYTTSYIDKGEASIIANREVVS